MIINKLFSIFFVVLVLSIDCAPKSKHYLVKVGDNADNKAGLMPAIDDSENVLDELKGKSNDYEDTADRD